MFVFRSVEGNLKKGEEKKRRKEKKIFKYERERNFDKSYEEIFHHTELDWRLSSYTFSYDAMKSLLLFIHNIWLIWYL